MLSTRSPKTSRRSDPALDRRLETEAHRFADDPRRPLAHSARHGDGPQRAVPGFGEPLPAPLRAALQPRLPIDLSALRVHHDEAAAQAADETGARAYAQGRDLVFGRGEWRPGHPEGQALLAHEAAHAAQQAAPGAVAGAQRDPRPADGPGRSPPSEHFTTMPSGESGVEDGHVLFARDEITLDAGDREALDALVTGAAPGTAVHVHGYASAEGDADYNLNLSAHRAVAVKAYLEGILPAETRIVAYAYGESSAFGGRAQNRRVGIDLIEPGGLFNPVGGGLGSGLHLLPPGALDLGGGTPGAPGGSTTPLFPPGVRLEDLIDPPVGPGFRPTLLDQSLTWPSGLRPPPRPFDYSGVAQTYTARGLIYGSEEGRSAGDLYLGFYGMYLQWGLGEDLAATVAQLSVDRAVSANLSMQAPTEHELLDRRMDTTPTIVPVSDILRWILDRK